MIFRLQLSDKTYLHLKHAQGETYFNIYRQRNKLLATFASIVVDAKE